MPQIPQSKESGIEKDRQNNTLSKKGGDQVCQLFPLCQIIDEGDATQLVQNLRDIDKLKLFQTPRFSHAFETSRDFVNLLRRPAMWSPPARTLFITVRRESRYESSPPIVR